MVNGLGLGLGLWSGLRFRRMVNVRFVEKESFILFYKAYVR